MSTTIQTKYGNASIDAQGYYVIHSNEKGNRGKKLHRLIFEDYHNVTLLPGVDIHHNDGNRINNKIENLTAIPHNKHASIHTCVHTEESKRKISESRKGEKHPNYGKHHSKKTLNKMSHALNKTGYFRVMRIKKTGSKHGFTWLYSYYDETGKRHRITSVDINKLKEKVLAKGLDWYKLERFDESTN